jgi:DNA repair exonuclease SbcCD ATPase subunit
MIRCEGVFVCQKKYFPAFSKPLACLLLWRALCWVAPLPLCSLESGPGENGNSLESELSRLLEISNQLSALNGRLRNELEDSRTNSRNLRSTLEKSKEELDVLKVELEQLRAASTALLNTQEESQTDLTLLRTALTKADTSLTNLEQSFAAYCQTAELRISSLEKSRKGWRIAFFAACGAAVAGSLAAALAGGRL